MALGCENRRNNGRKCKNPGGAICLKCSEGKKCTCELGSAKTKMPGC